MPPIDSPTAWGRNSTPICPAFSPRAGGRSSRAAPAGRCGSTRCERAAPAPLRRRRRLHLRGGRRDERAQTAPSSARAATTRSPTATSTSSPAPPSVFERVVVGVVNNPVRKEKTLFTAEERQALHRGGDRRPRQRRGADLLQPAGRVRPRTTAPRRSSRACGRSPTSSTSSRWRSSTASSTPASRAST